MEAEAVEDAAVENAVNHSAEDAAVAEMVTVAEDAAAEKAVNEAPPIVAKKTPEENRPKRKMASFS